MSFLRLNPISYFLFFLKKESDRFFISIAIRGFAFGMVTIFTPIYIYQHFNSLPCIFLFFAVAYGLYAVLVPFGGQIMMKIGIKKAILISHIFFWGFYICLLLLDISWIFILLSIILLAIGKIFFWPAYHVNFARVTETKKLGKEISKINFITALPGVLAPAIGGAIIYFLGYPALFTTVLCILFCSTIPLFLSPEIHQTYSDSFLTSYKRIFKKRNRYNNLGFAFSAIESTINVYVWPLFLAISLVGYLSIGSIATVSLIVSLLFILYMGRITDKANKTKLLLIGSILTAGAWIGKFFVISPISAFVAQGFYKLSRTAVGVPFQAIMYKRAEDKGEEIDEFIIYRDIVIAVSRCATFLILAGCTFFISGINLNVFFVLAAIFSFGFIFLGKISEIKSWFKKIKA
jgi:MFS family permease